MSGNGPATNPVVEEADLDWRVDAELDTEYEFSEGDGPVILDKGKPLSQSILWKLQRNYFEGQGIEAWRQGIEVDLHGWVYGIEDGLIRDLGFGLSGPEGLDKLLES